MGSSILNGLGQYAAEAEEYKTEFEKIMMRDEKPKSQETVSRLQALQELHSAGLISDSDLKSIMEAIWAN